MRVKVDGELAPGVSSKDIILYVIGKIGTAGGTGAVIEYCGSAIEGLSMEGRMSMVCINYFNKFLNDHTTAIRLFTFQL